METVKLSEPNKGRLRNTLYMVYVLGLFAATSIGLNSDSLWFLVIFGVGAIAVFVKIVSGVYTGRELAWILLLGGLLALNFLRNGDRTLFMSFLAIAGAKDTDPEEIFRIGLPIRSVLAGLTMSGTAIGLFADRTINGGATKVSYDGQFTVKGLVGYGFAYANHAYWCLFTIALLVLIHYGAKMRFRHYIYLTAMLYAGYRVFVCSTGWFTWLGMLVILAVYHLFRNPRARRGFLYLLSGLPPLCAALVIWLASKATAPGDLPLFFPKLIRGNFFARFSLARPVIEKLIYEPFGSAVREWKDIGYIHLLHNNGWILGGFFLIAYIRTMHRLTRQGKDFQVLALAAVSIYLIAEFTPLSIGWNLTLLLLAGELFKKGEQNKMKAISIPYTLKEMLRRWQLVLGICIATAVILAGYGYLKARGSQLSEEDKQTAVDAYGQSIEAYQVSIDAYKEQLAAAKALQEIQQEYVEGSIYMALDSISFYVATVQITVTETENPGGVLSAYTMFVKDGGFRDKVAAQIPGVEDKYLEEVTSCSTENNVFLVGIRYFDREGAGKILSVIQEVLLEEQGEIAAAQGDFQIAISAASVENGMDIGILSVQNTQRNTLQSYVNTVNDLESKLKGQEAALEKALADGPDYGDPAPNPKSQAVKFGIYGLVLGAFLGFCWFAFRALTDEVIRGERDLALTEIPLLGKSSRADYARAALQTLAVREGAEGIVLALGTETMEELPEKKRTAIRAWLEDCPACRLAPGILNEPESVGLLAGAGATVFLVVPGKSRYGQLREVRALGERSGAPLFGVLLLDE